MNLLAIETAGDACSVALRTPERCHERFELAPRRHAERILTLVQEVLEEAALVLAEMDALAFGRGPGSFTGVRVGASVIQGLAFGARLPVVPVSSLQALAQGAFRETDCARVLAALDARMGEVYFGAYEAGPDNLMVPVGEECVCAPDAVPVPDGRGWMGAGSGWGEHRDTLVYRLGKRVAKTRADQLASAVDVATLAVAAYARGESVSPEQALPVYLRNQVTRKRRE